MERKGLRVNMGKTKAMKYELDSVQAVDYGKWPCGVCRKGVGNNSIVCGGCKKWVHKKCLGVKRRLKVDIKFTCSVCLSCERSAIVQEKEKELSLGDAAVLNVLISFVT